MKQQNNQPSHPFTVFSVTFLLFLALTPLINHLFSVTVALLIVAIIGVVFIVGALEIWFKGYLKNTKVKDVFLLVGVLSIAILIFYSVGQQKEITTTTVTKEVNAKVITEYGFSSNYRVVLIEGDNVIPVEDVKNWKDFRIGDSVYGIETVRETTTVTDVFGRNGSYDRKYVILKGKE